MHAHEEDDETGAHLGNTLEKGKPLGPPRPDRRGTRGRLTKLRIVMRLSGDDDDGAMLGGAQIKRKRVPTAAWVCMTGRPTPSFIHLSTISCTLHGGPLHGMTPLRSCECVS
eukprot:GHVU01185338.1.p2 GENE.GHVU01185338.1~~GHVU01185338.1.p2  ORF type:complete len:112 (-),score=8.66 GHVU01185338.1:349-684(-)